jgi:hypothetical protein
MEDQPVPNTTFNVHKQLFAFQEAIQRNLPLLDRAAMAEIGEKNGVPFPYWAYQWYDNELNSPKPRMQPIVDKERGIIAPNHWVGAILCSNPEKDDYGMKLYYTEGKDSTLKPLDGKPLFEAYAEAYLSALDKATMEYNLPTAQLVAGNFQVLESKLERLYEKNKWVLVYHPYVVSISDSQSRGEAMGTIEAIARIVDASPKEFKGSPLLELIGQTPTATMEPESTETGRYEKALTNRQLAILFDLFEREYKVVDNNRVTNENRAEFIRRVTGVKSKKLRHTLNERPREEDRKALSELFELIKNERLKNRLDS